MQGECNMEYIKDLREFPADMVDSDIDFFETAQRTPSMLGSWAVALLVFFIGSILLMVVNKDAGPLPLGLFFLTIGLIIHIIPGLRNPYARRAFLLSYSICVLVMGISQTYAMSLFETIQNTPDASTFYELTRMGVSRESLEDIRVVINAPLPVLVWRTLYTFTTRFDNAPYVGIMLNSFLVGIAGSITVVSGRFLIGDNPRNLCRLGNWFAACGMFWLFGAIFVRDAFALFLNVIILYACLKFLTLPCLKNLILMLIIVSASALCMDYVRSGTALLLVAFLALAVFSWTRRHRGSMFTFMFPLAAVIVIILMLPLLSAYSTEVRSFVSKESTSYGSQNVVSSSLGSTLIVTQPMPIRLPTGSLYLLVQPIPLWNNFRPYMTEYQWIKGWQGLFLLWITPSFFVGLTMSLKQAFRGGLTAPPLCFLAFYAIITTMAIAATSLETRHHGQFIPAILILASLPRKDDPVTHRKLRLTMLIWFGMVLTGHVMWVGLKSF
jgi:hypothetical protein